MCTLPILTMLTPYSCNNYLIDTNKLLNKFEDTAKEICLHIKSDKTEYMCLNHENQIKNKISHDIKRVE